jgi:hypothetical protein
MAHPERMQQRGQQYRRRYTLDVKDWAGNAGTRREPNALRHGRFKDPAPERIREAASLATRVVERQIERLDALRGER